MDCSMPWKPWNENEEVLPTEGFYTMYGASFEVKPAHSNDPLLDNQILISGFGHIATFAD